MGSGVTMSKLHVAGWGFFVGAFGQAIYLGPLLPRVPGPILFGVLYVPWLTIYITTFATVPPPIGVRAFRLCLLCPVCAYGLVCILIEILHFILHVPPLHGSFMLIRAIMYFGCLGFRPLLRAYLFLRRYESKAGI